MPTSALLVSEYTAGGAYYYNNSISAARAMRQKLPGGETISDEAFIFFKGLEADGASLTGAQTTANLRQMIADFKISFMYAFQKASEPVLRFIIDQQAYGTTGTNHDGEVTTAALNLARSGELFMLGPTYWCDWFYGVNDPHWRPRGYRNYWEHLSRAVAQIRATGDWKPCHIEAQPTRSGNDITVPIYVPFGALVLDTTTVTNPGNYGFVYSGGTINSVAITNDGSADHHAVVTITLAPGASAGNLDYAYENGSNGRNGPTTGPRGNLRDSDTFVTDYESWPIRNWLCRDRWSIA
jgi:hypothetical protein